MKDFVAVVTMGAAIVAGAYEVENVAARSRFPWNGLIDIDYEITGAKSGEAFAIDVTASYSNGVYKLIGRTYKSDPIAGAGQNHLVWDMGTDCPDVFAPDMKIAVSATPFGDKTPVYCVIDLSGGKDADKYPVRYTTVAPVHSVKANDACKTTELWLRRIRPAGRSFTTRSGVTPKDSNSSYFSALTKDYYMSVFEMTQQQWFLLTGTWPSRYSNETWRATRPLQNVTVNDLRGKWGWPDDKSISADSPLQKLRTRTGIARIDLPTEEQWSFAETAGPVYKGSNPIYRYYKPDEKTTYSYSEVARTTTSSAGDNANDLCDPDSGTACVGSYAPNNFGLYDMLGNVRELCLNPYVATANIKTYYMNKGYEFPIMDPEGIPVKDAKEINGKTTLSATARGGGINQSEAYSDLWHVWDQSVSSANYNTGFRLCITCE